MQPTMTMTTATAADGADAPVSIEDRFAMLTEEEKEKVIAFAERLKAERCSR